MKKDCNQYNDLFTNNVIKKKVRFEIGGTRRKKQKKRKRFYKSKRRSKKKRYF
jgi:hypothetical protein